MRIVVQKFGGTSVATPELREEVCKRVREAKQQGFSPVVVVSAMGREGEPYATDTLKGLALEASSGSSHQRELDMIMHCGEIISSVIMANTLRSKGFKARAMTGGQAGMVTSGAYGEADVVDFIPEKIRSVLSKDEVAVVCGFQGMDANGEVNTMGRGGSDTSAVIIGAGLEAERIEIYTDVNGIMTADPRLLSEARMIDQITYNEVCQLAYEGAKVIHPRAVEVAMQNNVQVIIKNLRERTVGTVITSEHEVQESQDKGFFTRGRRVVSGIAHIANQIQVMVEMENSDMTHELELFQGLGDAGIAIDLINVFPQLKVFTIHKEDVPRAEKFLSKLGIKYSMSSDCAKVSVVGVGMRNTAGVMAKIVQALHEQNIRILQTGDSSITISLLINESDLEKAIKTLHGHFNLGIQEEDSRVLA